MQTLVDKKTQEAGHVLISSLNLLGVSIVQASRELGCAINRDMFVQANQKGLNAVLYLLYERIEGRESVRKELKGVWPIKDSVHQRDFNKIMHKVVLELSNAGYMPRHLAASFLQGLRQLSGFRLTSSLCYLAAFALTKSCFVLPNHEFVFQELPNETHALEVLYRALRSQNETQREDFISTLREMSKAQNGCSLAAEQMGAEYCKNRQELSGLTYEDTHVMRQEARHTSNDGQDIEASPVETAFVNEAGDLWGKLIVGAAKQRKVQGAMETIVTRDKHPHAIDGIELQLNSEKTYCEAGEVSSVVFQVNLLTQLQEWRRLLEASEGALLEASEVQRLEHQNRPAAPLLAHEHQQQAFNIRGQHILRLQGQKQFAVTLHDLLKAAGVQRESLSARVSADLGLTLPGAEFFMDEPKQGLIQALYPEQGQREDIAPDSLAVKASGSKSKIKSSELSKYVGAVWQKSDLADEAIPSSFAGSIRPLRAFSANAGLGLFNDFGSNTGFGANFADSGGKACDIAAAKLEIQRRIECLWQTIDKAMDPESMLASAAAPRRLSFSGTTPVADKSEELPSNTSFKLQDPPKNIGVIENDVLSVQDLISRMSRLRSRA